MNIEEGVKKGLVDLELEVDTERKIREYCLGVMRATEEKIEEMSGGHFYLKWELVEGDGNSDKRAERRRGSVAKEIL